jgi:prepilin-type N-terminal cleavage/methylation domain-containing protein
MIPSRSSKSQHGFSLVELMTVLAVMSILAVLSVPALRSLTGADGLSSETGVVANLLSVARTQAISLRTPVQVRIATGTWTTGTSNDNTSCYRRISLWKLQQTDPNNQDNPNYTPTYVQMTAWQSVGPNVCFESTGDPTMSNANTLYGFSSSNTPYGSYTYFMNSAYTGATLTTGSAAFTLPNPTPTGATASVVALEFLPTGALNTGSMATPSNIYLLLTDGFYNGTSLTYTEKQSPMNNWAQVRINYLTGEISVVRP